MVIIISLFFLDPESNEECDFFISTHSWAFIIRWFWRAQVMWPLNNYNIHCKLKWLDLFWSLWKKKKKNNNSILLHGNKSFDNWGGGVGEKVNQI